MSSQGLPQAERKRMPLAVRAILFFAAYFCVGFLSVRLPFVQYHPMAFWPQSGVLLGALLVAGEGEWFVFVLAAVPASILFEMLCHHRSPWAGVVFICTNFVQATLGS